jgi:V8-like Glu-specific endopeptidase
MSSLLTAFSYPWSQREAQQLHATLTQLYPSGSQAVALVNRAGLSPGLIFAEQPAYDVWTEILTEAAKHGLLAPLVQQAHDRLAPSSPVRPFLTALLAGAVPPLDAELDSGGAAGGFLYADDTVSEQEALLYADDLTIFTSQLPKLITTLSQLVELSPAVCRLTVDLGGSSQYGTAFRIGPDMLLTNWHVLYDIRSKRRASAVMAEFGYETDTPHPAGMALSCDVTSIQANEANDWAIIRPTEALTSEWPIIPLQRLDRPQLRSATYIIQHPGGNAKRLGYVRNQVSYVNDRVVQYLTDTQGGSSGAPVFNEMGEVIAVHHLGGRPHTLLGKAPLKKNEGILVARILDDFAQQGILLS